MDRPTRPTTQELQQVIFSDFTNNLNIHPITGNLTRLTNKDSIKQALRNLILTNTGERIYNPNLGLDINKLLFETFIDDTDTYIIREKIIRYINQYEPRVELIDVQVLTESNSENAYNSATGRILNDSDLTNSNGDYGNALIINIVFKIINTTEQLSLNLLLERNR